MLSHPVTGHLTNAAALTVCAVSSDHWLTIAVGVGAMLYYGTYLFDWIEKKRRKSNEQSPPKAD